MATKHDAFFASAPLIELFQKQTNKQTNREVGITALTVEISFSDKTLLLFYIICMKIAMYIVCSKSWLDLKKNCFSLS